MTTALLAAAVRKHLVDATRAVKTAGRSLALARTTLGGTVAASAGRRRSARPGRAARSAVFRLAESDAYAERRFSGCFGLRSLGVRAVTTSCPCMSGPIPTISEWLPFQF